MRQIRFITVLTAFLCATALISCSHDEDLSVAGTKDGYVVGLYVGSTVTRTSIADNGLSTKWSPDDHISVWAVSDNGDYHLNNKDFSIHGLDSGHAFFTSTLLEPMSEGNYTYYALYPRPAAASATTATLYLPSAQDGKVSAGSDFMLATPVRYHELECLPEIEDHSNMTMEFNHLLHVIRFYIPEDEDGFSSNGIEKLNFTMPYDAAGQVSVDITGNTAPVLSNGVKNFTIDCTEPVAASGNGSKNYICASVFPHDATLESNSEISVTAYSETDRYECTAIDVAGRCFLPGHSSAAKLHPVSSQPYYHIICRIGDNHLGERISSFTVKSGETELYAHDNTGNDYSFFSTDEELLGEGYSDWFESLCSSLSSGSATVTFDSPNATADIPIPASHVRINGHNVTVDLGDIPYLLYENFDEAGTFTYHDAYYNSVIGVGEDIDINNDMDRTGNLLNSYMPQNGWNAARVGLMAGDKIRINVRYQSGAWIIGRYCGRLDTPALSRIKSGRSVKVNLQFDYSFYIPEGMNVNDVNNEVAYFRLGTHTSSMSSALDGKEQNEITGTYYESERNKSGSVSSMKHYSGTKDGVTSQTRFVFWPLTTQSSRQIAANCAYYLYIDNIKVSINN